MCACGSEWFELRTDIDSTPARVAIDGNGIVSAYTGAPHCASCGAKWSPPRERLRIIK